MSAGLAAPDYAAGVRAGDRRMLAKTLTLLESRAPEHAACAEQVLELLLPHSGGALRLGVSGAPGVGKSSFIEALGLRLLERGERVAVLAIDPSSALRGGSILGDKTRMARLAAAPAAFVRPSPAGGALGGVASRTRECVLACEAAGFGVVIVETVGVGQSELEVSELVDCTAVLLQPAAGDELQGIKRGLLEVADIALVHKADGELRAAAEATRADFAGALALLRVPPPVLCASAHSGEGVDAFWERVLVLRAAALASGEHARRRSAQRRAWLWRLLRDGLEQALRADPETRAQLAALEQGVETGTASPARAARALLERLLGRTPPR